MSGGSAGKAERWTIRRLMQTTTEYLAQKGSDSARLDTELLLARALGTDRVQLYLRMEQPLLPQELDAFRELVRRRAAHEPVAYILGRRDFYGITLEVAPEVLIPRPATEILVDAALEFLGADAQARMLDIGTGSGAIALALLKERPGLAAVATDVSAPALALAKKNAAALGLETRAEFREGSLLAPLAADEVFGLVASNPPYIAEAELVTLSPDVRDYEPRGALTPGADGLALVKEIVGGAARHLRAGGLLLIEIGATQGEAAYALAEAAGAWQDIEVRRDLAGLDRLLVARRRDH